MSTTVTEIAPDVFRISTFAPDFGIQFNQFLVRDDEPFLMHTGFKRDVRRHARRGRRRCSIRHRCAGSATATSSRTNAAR